MGSSWGKFLRSSWRLSDADRRRRDSAVRCLTDRCRCIHRLSSAIDVIQGCSGQRRPVRHRGVVGSTGRSEDQLRQQCCHGNASSDGQASPSSSPVRRATGWRSTCWRRQSDKAVTVSTSTSAATDPPRITILLLLVNVQDRRTSHCSITASLPPPPTATTRLSDAATTATFTIF